MLGLAFIVIFARFVWVMAMEWVHSRAERADRPFGLENVRTAAVMTLGGPKGAITLPWRSPYPTRCRSATS